MSTRACIARVTGPKSFAGAYSHWDGYPSGLGAELFRLYNGHFAKDLPAMLKTLIDDHPAGWSTIQGKDWSLPIGFVGYRADPDEPTGPECYCHGNRSEEANPITQANATSCGVEWAYALEEAGGFRLMHVLSSFHKGGEKMIGYFGFGDPDATWVRVATVDLDGDEPDWKGMS